MSAQGHNSKGKAGPVNADRLKSFIERIEKLEEERKAIGGDVKDVYSEAKGVGYDVATMRKIVALRSKDPADRAEADTLLDVYKHALGMATGGTVTIQAPPVSEEELEARAGRIVMEVDRCMVLVTGERPPKIEDIQRLIGCSSGKASKLRGLVQSRISRQIDQTRESENPATPSPVSPETEKTEPREADSSAVDAGHLSPPSDPAAEQSTVNPSPERVSLDIESGQGTHPGTHSEFFAESANNPTRAENAPVATSITDDDATDAMLAARDRLESLKAAKGFGA